MTTNETIAAEKEAVLAAFSIVGINVRAHTCEAWNGLGDDKFGMAYIDNETQQRLSDALDHLEATIAETARKEGMLDEYKRCVTVLTRDHSHCPIPTLCIGYQNALSDLINEPPEAISSTPLV